MSAFEGYLGGGIGVSVLNRLLERKEKQTPGEHASSLSGELMLVAGRANSLLWEPSGTSGAIPLQAPEKNTSRPSSQLLSKMLPYWAYPFLKTEQREWDPQMRGPPGSFSDSDLVLCYIQEPHSSTEMHFFTVSWALLRTWILAGWWEFQ